MKVFISPHPSQAPYGIARVVEALYRELPALGIELVDNEADADVVNVHATAFVETKKPVVYSSHGFYWADQQWPEGLLFANQTMIDYMVRAQAITAVSEWVAHAISRGIARKPHVIYHGVDTNAWTPSAAPTLGYVLWNKARADIVSNPEEMQALASIMPGTPFVSTIGQPTANVQITGVVSQDVMRDMVAKAGVYLATARETFGIGTLEAMACGVPVVGWAHGGQTEIIEHGYNGLLAKPGDYQTLARYVTEILENREEFSKNARQSAITRWTWHIRVRQYAELFRRVYTDSILPRPTVSVVVTCHNLARYLGECLDYMKRQTLADFECIVVDDASDDDPRAIFDEVVGDDERFAFVRPDKNLGLSGARNFGFTHTHGRYVAFLDADDIPAPNALELLARGLDDPAIHIAYGHLDVLNDATREVSRNPWPFQSFDWIGQMAHMNQLSYFAMMRREVFVATGGYRVRDWRAEDASFWCRATSFGWRAEKVTEESVLLYRMREGSKSQIERQAGHDDGDWTSWFPWRVGAASGNQGHEMVSAGAGPLRPATVPFGAQGRAPQQCWPVWSHHDPLISVVIPVGPGHEGYLIDALDSVMAQTFPHWEAVVVNDTGHLLSLDYAHWARVVNCGKHSIAAARNAGVAAARGPLVLFLDADDILMPDAMTLMLAEYVAHEGSKYIYSDWYSVEAHKGEFKRHSARPYDRSTEAGMTHPINILINRQHVLNVGGFDGDLPAWEDWGLFIKLAIAGYCGTYLAQPGFIYRLHAGNRREESDANRDKGLAALKERFGEYFGDEGVKKEMAACCDGSEAAEIIIRARDYGHGGGGQTMSANNITRTSATHVRLEFVGDTQGAATFKMPGMSKGYRAGNNPLDKYLDNVPRADAEILENSGLFVVVLREGDIDLRQAAVIPVQPSAADPWGLGDRQPVATGYTGEPGLTQPTSPPVLTSAEGEDQYAQRGALSDPADLSIPKLREYVVGLGVVSLRHMLAQEIEGKNRVGAVDILTTAIDDTERING